MKKMNIKTLLLVIACAAILCGSVVMGTIAWLTAGDNATNDFVPGVVGCYVDEQVANGAKTSVKIQNREGNVSAFIRVTLVASWVDSEGNIGPTPATVSIKPASGWFEKDGYYYYKNAVAAGGSTEELLSSHIAAPTGGPEGYTCQVQVLAQSIQAEGTDAAEVWGVTVSGNTIS